MPFKHLEATSNSVLYLKVDVGLKLADDQVTIEVIPQVMKILVPAYFERVQFG